MGDPSLGEIRFMGEPIIGVTWLQLDPFQFTFPEAMDIDETVEISYAVEGSDGDPEFRIVRFAVDGVEMDASGIEMKPAAGVTITINRNVSLFDYLDGE